MIKAKATTEQANKGQIGHPAACMIVSKSISKKCASIIS
jgi:hypothetical protein